MNLDVCAVICKDFRNHAYLHTFIQDTIDGESFVMDYPHNLVLKKQDYFHIMDVEVVSIIKNKDLVEYTANLLRNPDLGRVIHQHEFLCFIKQVNEAVLRLEREKRLIKIKIKKI